MKLCHKPHSKQQGFPGILCHIACGCFTLLQCKMRRCQETLVQDLNTLFYRNILELVRSNRNRLHRKLYQYFGYRQHDNHRRQVKDTVDHGNDERVCKLCHKRKMYDRIDQIKQHHEKACL